MNGIWILFLIILAGAGLGRIGSRLWRDNKSPFLDRFVLDVSMGLGLLSLVFFAAAAGGLLHSSGDEISRPVVLCLVFAIVGMRLVREGGMSLMNRLKSRRLLSWQSGVWVGVLIIIALIVLIPALAPPSDGDWDSLAYHLAVPKLYLQHGGFYYIDYSSHSNFPFLVEMLYLPALSVGDPIGAKLVHYFYGALLVLAVVMLVRKHFSAKAAPLAALIIAGMPIVMWEATTAYVDLATALYTVVAVYLFLEYLDKPARYSIIGCGIAAGFAASTKMTALALFPLLAIWLIADCWLSKRQFEWKGGLALCIAAILACSPWYLKTLFYTGNPVYPFFYGVFGGKDWSIKLAQNYTMLQAKFGTGHSLASFLRIPYDLTMHSDRFYDTAGLFVGPILLVMIPLLLIFPYKDRKFVGLGIFAVAQVVIWFFLTQQSRYLIPTFALLAILIAAVVHRAEHLKLLRTTVYTIFGATAAFGALTLSGLVAQAGPFVFGMQTQQQYLSRALPIYSAQEWINQNTPKDAKVALFGDTRGFYLDRPYVWADPGHNVAFTKEFRSADDILSNLRSHKISYIMINRRTFPTRDNATGAAALIYESIDLGRLELVYGDETTPAVVYLIK